MRILVLPGDCIGPVIAAATMQVVESVNASHGLGLSFDHDSVGDEGLQKYGSTFAPQLAERFRTCDGVILGPNGAASNLSVDLGGSLWTDAFGAAVVRNLA